MTPTPHIHHQLIQQCQRGDRKAQRKIYDHYSKAMYHTSLRIVHDVQEAEDVLQESFIKAFTTVNQLKDTATFGSWLKRIVINNSINAYKKLKLPTSELNVDVMDEEDEVICQWDKYSIGMVKKAIDQLPSGYKTVFNLYMMEDYSHKEISMALSISESTSKSQLNRAKQKLKALLENEG